jgi:hypothetical protein
MDTQTLRHIHDREELVVRRRGFVASTVESPSVRLYRQSSARCDRHVV